MPPYCSQSLYELLEVAHGASAEEIEGAYKRLSGMVAADSLAVYAMLDEAEVTSLRTQVEQAYRTLSDPVQRQAYDAVYQAQTLQAVHTAATAPSGQFVPDLRPAAAYSVLFSESRSVAPVDGGRPHKPLLEGRAGPPAAGPSRRTPGPASGASSGPSFSFGRRTIGVNLPRSRRLLQPTLALEYSENMEVSGSVLRRLRESAQAELTDVSDITKISKRYLAALEADDYASLPANVYVRGFVSEYARVLGLEPRQVAQSYMTQYMRRRTQNGE